LKPASRKQPSVLAALILTGFISSAPADKIKTPFELLRSHARELASKAEVAVIQKQINQACTAYEESANIWLQLVSDDQTDLNALGEAAEDYTREGDVLLENGRLEQAQAAYDKGFSLWESSDENKPTEQTRLRGLATSAGKLGRVALLLKQTDTAIQYYQIDCNTDRRLHDLEPANLQWVQELALNLYWVGELNICRNKSAEGMASLRLSVQSIVSAEDQLVAGYRWIFEYTINLDDVANLLFAQVRAEDALETFMLSRQLREWLLQREPNNVDYQRALAIALGNVGGLQVRLDRLPGAINLYRDSIAQFQKIVADRPFDEASVLPFAQVLQDCGDVYVRLLEFDSALIRYQLSRARFEELAARSPNDISLQLQASGSTYRVAQVYTAELDYQAAAGMYSLACSRLEQLSTGHPDQAEIASQLALAYIGRGYVENMLDEDALALADYEAARKKFLILQKKDPSSHEFDEPTAGATLAIAKLLQKAGRTEDARNEFNQSSEALFELSQKGNLDEQGRRWLQEADDQRQHLSLGE
jgi:tetratricopeptide (TPR) repeat protein